MAMAPLVEQSLNDGRLVVPSLWKKVSSFFLSLWAFARIKSWKTISVGGAISETMSWIGKHVDLGSGAIRHCTVFGLGAVAGKAPYGKVESLELYIVTPCDIGLDYWPSSLPALRERLAMRGFVPCPPDTPVVLREIWRSQSDAASDWLLVYTESAFGGDTVMYFALKGPLALELVSVSNGIPLSYRRLVCTR